MSVCEKCEMAEKRLDERNEATKVWIQSCTQTRAWGNRMEQEMLHWKGLAESRQNEIDLLKSQREQALTNEAKLTDICRKMLIALEPGFSPDTPWNAEWRVRLQRALGLVPSEESNDAG